MKRLIAILAAAAAAGTVSAQPGVGLSIGINQPGVYGRIDIGGGPPPVLVAPQPVIIAPPRERFDRRPLYLYVAPHEQSNWRRYCGRYAACGQPVYFVREDWVRERYIHAHPDWARRHPGRGDFHDRRDYRGPRGADRDHRDRRD